MNTRSRRLLLAAFVVIALLAVPVVALADHSEDPDGAVLTPPTLSGTAMLADTLTVAPGTWQNDGDEVTNGYLYQWMRCDATGANCAAISGATSAGYVATGADVGNTLRGQVIQVTTENAGDPGDGEGPGHGPYSSLSQLGLSAPSAVVQAPPPPPAPATLPASASKPKISVVAPHGGGVRISGVSRVGDLLIANAGKWTGTGPITFTYRWLRCDMAGKHCVTIAGATGPRYRLTKADTGHTVRVVVIAHNPAGSKRAESSQTSRIRLIPILHVSELVHVTGGVVRVKMKGSNAYETISRTRLIPDGSTLDTTAGSISMEVAADHNHHYYNAQVHGASFVVHQLQGSRPLTQFQLLRQNLGCPAADPALRRGGALAFAARRRPRHSGHTLWAHDSGGRFTTRGQYASAIVRGTTWTTTETCEGTVFHVLTGSISVFDRVTHRHVTVNAGHSYTAFAPEPPGEPQGD